MTASAAALKLLTRSEMLALAQACEAGALRPPFTPTLLKRSIRDAIVDDVARGLNALGSALAPEALAAWLRLLADERASVQLAQDQAQLVWTGPEAPSATTRDTWVTMTELFRGAQESIDIASYAIHDGRHVLEELAQRMRELPGLRVRMFLHIHREWDDTATPPSTLVTKFAAAFHQKHWPSGSPLPQVFYDPRTVAQQPDERASLHAKVVVVDRRRALVTSANLTEAAQRRNIEAGLLVMSESIAKALTSQFDTLVERGDVVKITGL